MAKTTLLFIILIFCKHVAAKSAASSAQFEVRTAPLAYLAQWVTLDFTWSPFPQLSLGPSYIKYGAKGPYGNMFLPTYSGNAYGMNISYYSENFNSDSWYIGTHLYSEKYDSYPHAYLGSYTHEGTSLIAVVGYRWISSENLATQLGVGSNWINYDTTKKPDNAPAENYRETESRFYIEFKLGYLF